MDQVVQHLQRASDVTRSGL